jgi:energy-coupling factor transporter ATP-binding protein EcfA2
MARSGGGVSAQHSPVAAPGSAELVRFAVKGLFGRYDHDVRFPRSEERDAEPSLVILHGANGIGKTTVLLMLDGLLRLDFDVFRVRPFSSCELVLSPRKVLRVRSEGLGQPLLVTFGQHRMALHPTLKGAADRAESTRVEAFRKAFFAAASGIAFQLISTERAPYRGLDHDGLPRDPTYDYALLAARLETDPEARLAFRLRAGPPEERPMSLEQRVRRFITDAQVNYRQYFLTEFDLFARVLAVIEEEDVPEFDAKELLERAQRIRRIDQVQRRYGLQTTSWNYDQVADLLRREESRPGRQRHWALAALAAYLEGIEGRVNERALITQRLGTFESEIAELMPDKKVTVGRSGLTVRVGNQELKEPQLSTGEFHLLYLLVAALTARRRGTLIAIDEPEMSMHVAWQRRLIRSLLAVASDARPQLLLATHSPEVVGEYRSHLSRLGGE